MDKLFDLPRKAGQTGGLKRAPAFGRFQTLGWIADIFEALGGTEVADVAGVGAEGFVEALG